MNNSLVNPPNRISKLAFFHIDTPLLLGLLTLMCYGLIVLYSASGQSQAMFQGQLIRLALAITVMIAFAQINPQTIRRW